ncbi:hypothetical protein SAICODRAFT_33339 [Saitoella complicata NRRL Y-17804]|nr:uncharacterized protein SAICODRAFT_33339 [Saitoella complicata NRRL Y-17804]ODQ55299.1 hypothetical protein SAICODRAFT_33339 [Saitoella complicata NRRL Y-17804]
MRSSAYVPNTSGVYLPTPAPFTPAQPRYSSFSASLDPESPVLSPQGASGRSGHSSPGAAAEGLLPPQPTFREDGQGGRRPTPSAYLEDLLGK